MDRQYPFDDHNARHLFGLGEGPPQSLFLRQHHPARAQFEYHASGEQILIGRLIVFAYLVLYNIMLTFVPLVGIGLGVLMLFFVPWLVARGGCASAQG